jgi:hypothetical protein
MKKKLLISHNVFSDNVPFVRDFGGFSCPSIGISTNEHPMNNFGDISLILDPNKFFPSKYPTYTSDVYSPRMPERYFKVDERALNKWEDKVREEISLLNGKNKAIMLTPNLANSGRFDKGVQDNMSKFQRSIPLLYLYAKEKGISVKIPTTPIELTGRGLNFLKNKTLLNKIYKENLHNCIMGTPEHEKLSKIALSAAKQYSSQVFSAIEEKDVKEDFSQDLLNTILKQSFSKDLLSFSCICDLNSYFNNVMKAPLKINKEKAYSRLNKLIDGPRKKEAFQTWIKETFSPFISDPYFYKRNHNGEQVKKAFTIDNVTKHMSGNIRGGEGGAMHGAGEIRAAVIQRFRNKSDIIDRIDLLCSEDEMTEIADDFNATLSDFPEKLAPYCKFKTDTMFYRGTVYEEIRDYATNRNVKSLSESFNVDDIPQDLMQEIDTFISELKHTKSHYFEAKVQGKMQLSDFSAAIVPKDIPKESLKILKECGLKIKSYDPKCKISRTLAVQSFDQYLFGEGCEFAPIQSTLKNAKENSELNNPP